MPQHFADDLRTVIDKKLAEIERKIQAGVAGKTPESTLQPYRDVKSTLEDMKAKATIMCCDGEQNCPDFSAAAK
jgi:hypothetical protein